MSPFYQKVLDFKAQGKVYVIADVGSNYKSEKDLIDSVRIAKNTGADAVKFQYISPNELHGLRFKLSDFPFERLKQKANELKIDFMCTAFSPEGYDRVNPFVDAHKIASSEMSHIRILEKLKTYNKPVIISTGAHFKDDIERVLKFMSGQELMLFHANVKYPTKFTDIEKFKMIKNIFTGPVGYSDHTTSIDAVPTWFKDNGASIYEKHLNPFDYTDTPDAQHSLNTTEFSVLTSILHNEPVSYTEENEARLKHVRRIVATKDLYPGDILHEGLTMNILRSSVDDANGLNPFYIGLLEGKKIKKEVKLGEGISLSHVK